MCAQQGKYDGALLRNTECQIALIQVKAESIYVLKLKKEI
jgi:hypothetical protein